MYVKYKFEIFYLALTSTTNPAQREFRRNVNEAVFIIS